MHQILVKKFIVVKRPGLKTFLKYLMRGVLCVVIVLLLSVDLGHSQGGSVGPGGVFNSPAAQAYFRRRFGFGNRIKSGKFIKIVY